MTFYADLIECPECKSPVTNGDRLVCFTCGLDPTREVQLDDDEEEYDDEC